MTNGHIYAHDSVRQDYLQKIAFLSDRVNTSSLARLIDHTLLRPDAVEDQFRILFQEAERFHFKAVCIPSSRLELASLNIDQLAPSAEHTKLCTVVGFPHGNTLTECKTSEVRVALKHGASEIDYVQNIGWVREKKWERLASEAKEILAAAQGNVVKVILETALLSDEEIFNSAQAAARGGIHILKTSTGFSSRGASLQDVHRLAQVVELMQQELGYIIGIKASGGIKTPEDAIQMLEAGATRLGTSAGVQLVSGRTASSQLNY